jgi:hypothetical protein
MAPATAKPKRSTLLLTVRYGIPAVLVVAGFVILLMDEGSRRWDGWAMCVGAGLAVLFLSVVFQMGAQGDLERDEEERARDYLREHGRWPDDPAPRG